MKKLLAIAALMAPGVAVAQEQPPLSPQAQIQALSDELSRAMQASLMWHAAYLDLQQKYSELQAEMAKAKPAPK